MATDHMDGQSRDHLVAARVALFEADLALAMGNHRAARIQIELAQAYLAETCKGITAKIVPFTPPGK